MAAGTLIKHKRKTGPFVGGELAAGELGLDVTNGVWYYSLNGTTVAQLIPAAGSGPKIYRATLFQLTGGAAPVPTVLENTTGAVLTWVRASAGSFSLTSNIALFGNAAKVFITVGSNINQMGSSWMIISTNVTTSTNINLAVICDTGYTDGALFNMAFEILIYP